MGDTFTERLLNRWNLIWIIFRAKIISYLSSGIGLWAKNSKLLSEKNKLFFLPAPQLHKSLLKEVYYLVKNLSCALELFTTESTLCALQLVPHISSFHFRQHRLNPHYRCTLENPWWISASFKKIFNRRIIALQCCVDFCHSPMWITHKYTYIPSSWASLPPL